MKTLKWLLALLAMFSFPVNAANPFRLAELSDAELNELRGRYVMPGRVIHFGVTMSSHWENSAGQHLGVDVQFNMDSRAQPSLYVTDRSSQLPIEADTASVTPGVGQVLGGRGLSEVKGVSQSVRSAGDFNEGLNSLDIIVSRTAEQAVPSVDAVHWDGPGSFSNAVGSVLVDPRGGLKILLDAGAQGATLQQIGSGNVVQQARFTGDHNSASNLATLTVALRDLPLGQDFANCTLEQLRALRPIGY